MRACIGALAAYGSGYWPGQIGVGNMERYPLCINGRLVSEMALVVLLLLLLLFMEYSQVLRLYDIAVRVGRVLGCLMSIFVDRMNIEDKILTKRVLRF